jgi:hypothetical protein
MEQGYNDAAASGCLFFFFLSVLSSQFFYPLFIEMELLRYYDSDCTQNPSVDEHLSSFKVKCFFNNDETHEQN